MKKILIGAVVLAALLFGVGPFAVGVLSEKQIKASLKEARGADVGVIAELRDHNRGFLTSTGTILVAYTQEQAEAFVASVDTDAEQPMSPEFRAEFVGYMTEGLPLRYTMTHGPVLFDRGFGFGANDARVTVGDVDWASEAKEFLEVDELFLVEGRTGFTGNGSFDFSMPAFDIEDEDSSGTMMSAGVTGSGTWHQGKRLLNAEFTAPKFAFKDPEANLAVDNAVFNVSSTLPVNGVSLGTTSMHFGTIAMTFDEGDDVIMDGFRMDAEVSEKDGGKLLDMVTTLAMPNATFGEDKVSDFKIVMQMNDIDKDAANRFQEWANNVSEDDFNEQEMNELLHNVLSKGMFVAIPEMNITVNGDSMSMTSGVRTDAAKVPDLDGFFLMDIPMWMEILSGDLNFSADESLALNMATATLVSQLVEQIPPEQEMDPAELGALAEQQAPMFLDTLVQQGMIVRTDSGYEGTYGYENGIIKLNDIEAPAEMFFGP
ncbi:MAG: DUF945 family protein [Pseudomonadota bacterium]